MAKIHFPMRGLNKNWSTSQKPQFTSGRMSNVRPYDVLDDRARGGQRPGLSRHFSQQLGFTVTDPATLAETPTNTTWDAEGRVMTNGNALWNTAGVNLVSVGDVVRIIVDTSRVNVALGFGYRIVESVTSDTEIVLVLGISDGVGAPNTVDYEIGSGTAGLPVVDINQVTVIAGN